MSHIYIYIYTYTKHVLTFRHKICDFFFVGISGKTCISHFFEIAVFIITIFIIIHFFSCLSNSAVVE